MLPVAEAAPALATATDSVVATLEPGATWCAVGVNTTPCSALVTMAVEPVRV